MEKIQFKCELLSDIVMNDSPATEGKRKSLDFIPGNNFLGITAAQLYKETDEKSWLIFHSGHVRFGDAHPSIDGMRGLHIPALFFCPKLKKIEDGNCYIHHLLKCDDNVRLQQLKQCRTGFYTFNKEKVATLVTVNKDFAIKSAYDSDERRAKDNQMFGYEALCKGLIMYFTVEIDDEALAYKNDIIKALCGQHHVGRSRSAQYGWVEITVCPFEEVATMSLPIRIKDELYIAVYADSRLIFFDENGNNTFQPKAKDLGIIDFNAEIDWNLSQVRTFLYAPWNYKRQAFDADRCGIEKGSVFLVKTNVPIAKTNTVGYYKNEGFGHIIYNPIFLEGNDEGKSVFSFTKQEEQLDTAKSAKPVNTLLIKFLQQRKDSNTYHNKIIELVNDFVEKNAETFQKDRFASQWGSIRNLAMVYQEDSLLQKMIDGYLNHGVAADKWSEYGRRTALERFLGIEQLKGHLQEAIINLASEMAKICKS